MVCVSVPGPPGPAGVGPVAAARAPVTRARHQWRDAPGRAEGEERMGPGVNSMHEMRKKTGHFSRKWLTMS